MKKSLIVFFAGSVASGILFAQEDVTVAPATPAVPGAPLLLQPGPEITLAMPGGPGNVAFVSREFAFSLRAVKNAPYSADETTQSIQTLADGNRIVRTTTAHVDRDSEGRLRREVTFPAAGNEAQPHTFVTISDPIAGITYSLDSQNKTAFKMMRPTEDAAGQFAKLKTTLVEPPSNGQLHFQSASMQSEDSVTREDLGVQNIAGVNARGNRETITIPAEAIGNEMPIVITSERWFSPDLQIEVKSVRNDPRMGETTYSLTNINRTEPDPSLFQIPADYTVREAKPATRIIEARKKQ